MFCAKCGTQFDGKFCPKCGYQIPTEKHNEHQTLQTKKILKSASKIAFPKNYTVIDVETTGLNSAMDNIIEVAGVKVKNNKIDATFQSLINANKTLAPNIVGLTHITNKMLATAPLPSKILPAFYGFIGDDVVLGHNAKFDVDFLSNGFSKIGLLFENDYIDTLRLSRILYPEQGSHKLSSLISRFGVKQENAHRALDDCFATYQCYWNMKRDIKNRYGSYQRFYDIVFDNTPSKYNKINFDSLAPRNGNFNKNHLLHKKVCVFTGEFTLYSRDEIAQMVVDCGGTCANNVSSKTDFLILGDDRSQFKREKSTKEIRVEELCEKGVEVKVISESEFLKLI